MKVVLLPFSAFGHLIPYYQLALALGKAGVHVYYVSTPNNIKRLPKVPQNLSSFVHFVQFQLPVPEGTINPLPEGAEATIDVPVERFGDLIAAHDLLQHPLREFLVDNSPDWLIIDFLSHWAADIAHDCDVPLMTFFVFSAASALFFGPPKFLSGEGQKQVRSCPKDLTSPPHWVTFPSKVAYRGTEAIDAHVMLYGTPTAERLAKILERSRVVAVRSCDEAESKYLKSLEETLGKHVIPVGLLPPPETRNNNTTLTITNEKWAKIFDWLNERKNKSVVFVGFGSECRLSRDQVFEIAHGLLKSGVLFLWVLRKPVWAMDELDSLPRGFIQRMGCKGKVCFGWAPQLEILGHVAIGCSFFHSGWGSAIESLQFGHAMVVLPFINDQGLTARLLVEKGLAIEVKKSEIDGSFSRNDISKCLIRAMSMHRFDEGAGWGMKRRVIEASAIFGDRELHSRYIDRFVEYLQLNI